MRRRSSPLHSHSQLPVAPRHAQDVAQVVGSSGVNGASAALDTVGDQGLSQGHSGLLGCWTRYCWCRRGFWACAGRAFNCCWALPPVATDAGGRLGLMPGGDESRYGSRDKRDKRGQAHFPERTPRLHTDVCAPPCSRHLSRPAVSHPTRQQPAADFLCARRFPVLSGTHDRPREAAWGSSGMVARGQAPGKHHSRS